MVRRKNRYLVLSVTAKDGRLYDSIGPALPAAIRGSLISRYGEAAMEAADAGLAAPYYHHICGVAIVRCARSEHTKVVAACVGLSQVDCKGVDVKLLKLTGALRVARREAGQHIHALLEKQTLSPQQRVASQALISKLSSVC